MMDAIRAQIEQLDSKMAELRQIVQPEDVELLDVAIDDIAADTGTAVVEEVQEVVSEPVASGAAVIDAMIAKQPWRTDMPGTPVKDIRSAISLNDRVTFINNLFDEDPLAFQTDLTKINQMNTLEEVVDHVASAHPAWNLESEVVYRFMMAVRRRIR